MLRKFTFALLLFLILLPIGVNSQSFDYTAFEQIPGTEGDLTSFPDYLQALYKFVIGGVAIAGLLMLVIGGFFYMTAAGNNAQLTKAKDIIRDALLGIIIALFAWLLLFTINPDLIKIDLSGLSELATEATSLPGNPAAGQGGAQSGSPSGAVGGGGAYTPGQYGCGEVVNEGHAMVNSSCRYSQKKRNSCKGNPAYTDCSDFVYQAYKAAGCNTLPAHNTAGLIKHASPYAGSQSDLKAGDLIVYRYNNNSQGHVVMCEQDGCSTVTHAAGSKTTPNLKSRSPASGYLSKPGASIINASDYCSSANC